MDHLRSQIYKSENTEMKNINNTKKKAKTLKAKSSLLEFRKDFREPKEREIKIETKWKSYF